MKPETEVHDGLTFELPVWDPTPTEWNEFGSWAKDEDLTARCLASIRTAIPNEEELLAEARTAEFVKNGVMCRTFWGSHGCGRETGHPGLCVCDPGDTHSVGLKYGDADTFIVWHVYIGDTEFSLSSMHWTWFE